RPGAGEGRGDLSPDQAGLAHPGDDDAARAAVEQLDRPDEAVIEARAQLENAVGLEAQHAFGERQDPRAIHQWFPAPLAIARRSSSSRGNVSSFSMLGPSDGGRPSASVRSGSSWISMKSASTPTATAARASASTYWRSPPDRSP